MAARAVVSKATREFILPPDPRVSTVVPGVREVQFKGSPHLAVPHKHDAVRFCRNLGYLVPAPISIYYDWNGSTPFKTQMITAALLTMQSRAYVLSEMGTGKTRATLFAVDYLLREGDIKNCLVVAPLSTLSQVWDREIYQYFNHLSVGVLHGDRKRRESVLAQEHQVYVINHDGPKISTLLPLLVAKQFSCVVLDELAVFRNREADRWKAMFKIVNPVPYAWGLTGSPMPNEPLDAWAQIKMLTPHRAPPSARTFKSQTMRPVTTFKWVAKPEANDIVFSAMQPGVRYKRDDCVELPPVSYIARKAPMTAEQDAAYKKIIKTCTAMFAEGEVTAANEGVLFSKLLQIAGGWVYTKDKKVVALNNRDRIDELLQVIDEADGKVIVFAEFKHAAHALQKICAVAGIDSALVTGDVTKTVRDQIFTAFQLEASPRVLIAHPKCMSHGLTLTAANHVVWYTPTTSLETYEQANARITRPGQAKKQLIIHLSGSPIERKMYKRLQEKKTLQGALLEMFETGEADGD
jgi:SNF2 family DNA or RNA helicase